MPPPPIALPRRVAFVSYRLGGTDGVSIEAAKWQQAFRELGAETVTVAGSGDADVLVPGLAAASGGGRLLRAAEGKPRGTGGPTAQVPDLGATREALATALAGADLVVVENACSLPLNPSAGEAIASVLRGRPAILRHHDLAWQRPGLGDAAPPDDPAWWHVTINERSRIELSARGIEASTFYNSFDPDVTFGDRAAARAALGVPDSTALAFQPTRAIPRKNVPGGVLFARALGAVYWLRGPAEDGYDEELDRILGRAGSPVLQGLPVGLSMADAYAACDVVVLPSTFEGFGNPSVESALHRKPLAIGSYPVASELRRYGFVWWDASDPAGAAAQAARFLAKPDIRLLDRNERVARERFSTRDLAERLGSLVTSR